MITNNAASNQWTRIGFRNNLGVSIFTWKNWRFSLIQAKKTPISKESYEDIDEKFDQAIRSMELKENRSYWEDLSSCLSQFAKFANAAVESIDSTKNAKAARGLEIMADTEKTVVEQYRKLVYDLDSTISEHNERMKYIESKRWHFKKTEI